MINQLLLVLSFLSFGLITTAQAKKSPEPVVKSNQHLKVFDLAMASGDVHTATIALNYYLLDRGINENYADTLAMLYMQQGAYRQCYYWAQKRLQVKPDDTNLLELVGICFDKLQQSKEAIAVFDKLFKKTRSPYHAFKLMELQYGIKRLNECLETAQAAEKLVFQPSFIMTYNVGEQVGRTYLQAGIYNIHALALYDLDKKNEARAYLEKALALDTSFVLAKQNLAALNSMVGSKTKPDSVNNNQIPIVSPGNKQN
ncbi:MAG: hypothetical protein ABIN94_12240 [Ferruginibacter sp.]